MLPDVQPEEALPAEALPVEPLPVEALPVEALLPPVLPVDGAPPAMLPEVPVADEDGLDIEPPAPPPIIAFARMKLSAFDASPADADVPLVAGCRQPVTLTLSSDIFPPACRLLP